MNEKKEIPEFKEVVSNKDIKKEDIKDKQSIENKDVNKIPEINNNLNNIVENKPKFKEVEHSVVYQPINEKNFAILNSKIETLVQQYKEISKELTTYKNYILNENKIIFEESVKNIVDNINKELEQKLSNVIKQINENNNLINISNEIINPLLIISLNIIKYLELFIWKFKIMDIEKENNYENYDMQKLENIFKEKLNETQLSNNNKIEHLKSNILNLISKFKK